MRLLYNVAENAEDACMEDEKLQLDELLKLLPAGWRDTAIELGALRRARKIKTPEELLRLIFLYLTDGKSFAGTSALLQMLGNIVMSKIAIWKRIGNSAKWIQWMCVNFCLAHGILVDKPLWLTDKRVCLVDGSEEALAGNNKTYFRLHYALDLFSLGMVEMSLTDIKTGEKLTNFKGFGKNDIVVVADRAYGTIAGMEHLRELGSGFVLRLRARAFGLYNKEGREISLIRQLKGLKAGESMDLEVFYKTDGKLVPVRICATRKDKDSERSGLERIEKTNRRKRGDKAVSGLQSAYNKYIIVVTSIGKEVSAKQILELYRMRWQVEIAFKRLKSIFKYNEVPMRLDKNAYVWFYGKLLLSFLCDALVNQARFSPQEQDD
jgi:hypothetical protein